MAHVTQRVPQLPNSTLFLSMSQKKRPMGRNERFTRSDDAHRGKRNAKPSYRLIDSQSAKTTSANEDRVFNGGKKLKAANDI